jgi:siroheme decarboxylase
MVVWQIAEALIPAAGQTLVTVPGVTLCYHRRPADAWPYTLYCMIHARTRAGALAVLGRAEAAADLAGLPRAVLFSVRCFKQRGALVLPKGAAA